jgi:hypothetical protein
MIPRILLAATFAAAALPAQAALVVAKHATSNVTCASGTCTATAADAVLDIHDLQALLVGGDITVTGGASAQDIHFDAALHWTQAHRLTLTASNGIAISQPIVSQGAGGVTLNSAGGSDPGNYAFTGKGRIDFWDNSSSFIANGRSFTLVSDLNALSAGIAANLHGNFALAKDVDASVLGAFGQPVVADNYFGVFEGLGHAIDKLAFKGGSSAGLGLFAGVEGQIRDVALTGVHASASQTASVGVLAVSSGAILQNDSVQGTVKKHGDGFAALLTTLNDGQIVNCKGSGSVAITNSRHNAAGGLVATNEGSIEHSTSSAAASGQLAGGLVGLNRQAGTIRLSSATGTVMGEIQATVAPVSGGLVGENDGTIDQSFATGDVHGGQGYSRRRVEPATAGGLVGVDDSQQGQVNDSYATGSVTVIQLGDVGGLMGLARSVFTSYSTGSVGGGPNSNVGGFVVVHPSFGADDYWDTDTSGTTVGCAEGAGCSGVTGLGDAALKSGLPAGFSNTIWGSNPSINNGYPFLLNNPPQ